MREEPRDFSNVPADAHPPAVTPSIPPPPDFTPIESKPVSQLTPEEQMALFEKELKETDWGHQPC